MNQKLIDFIQASFLSPLLEDSEITDITYNGTELFYQHNLYGRKKANFEINPQEVQDFLRQIANLSEQQFSYSVPLLDISFGQYRLNAVHSALTRVNNEKSVSFSLRIASLKPRIVSDSDFMPSKLEKILRNLINGKISIVIGGRTGTGKTELQKYLLNLIEENGRIIIIDNVQELDCIRNNSHLDITSWLVNDYIHFGDFESLIKNAIRSNPDWLIIAESRGQEMSSVLNAAMTGHPIITTIHAKDIYSMPHRMGRMVLLIDKTTNYDDALEDIADHFPIYIYLNKKIVEGKIVRFIETVGEIDTKKKTINLIYEFSDNKSNYFSLSNNLIKELSSKGIEASI